MIEETLNKQVGNGQWAVGQSQPTVVRIFAHLFSYIFHPLFVPVYVSLFLMYIHPSYFSGIDDQSKFRFSMFVVQCSIAYPLLTIGLLKGLGFIDSVFLKTQKDRIIPYIAAGIFYFWQYQVSRNYPGTLHPIVPSFMLGVFLAASAALIANIYFKISMHAIGMGGWIGLFLIIMQSNTMWMAWPLSAVLLIAGLVCTSRLVVSDHSSKDIYMGLLVGLVSQFAGAMVML